MRLHSDVHAAGAVEGEGKEGQAEEAEIVPENVLNEAKDRSLQSEEAEQKSGMMNSKKSMSGSGSGSKVLKSTDRKIS